MKVLVPIDPHEDGVHCGMCHGRWSLPYQCDFFVSPIRTVRQYLLQAERCQECLDAEVKEQ